MMLTYQSLTFCSISWWDAQHPKLIIDSNETNLSIILFVQCSLDWTVWFVLWYLQFKYHDSTSMLWPLSRSLSLLLPTTNILKRNLAVMVKNKFDVIHECTFRVKWIYVVTYDFIRYFLFENRTQFPLSNIHTFNVCTLAAFYALLEWDPNEKGANCVKAHLKWVTCWERDDEHSPWPRKMLQKLCEFAMGIATSLFA